jgi:hypothetical protein
MLWHVCIVLYLYLVEISYIWQYTYLRDNAWKNQLDALVNSYNLISIIDFPIRIYNDSSSAVDNIFIYITRKMNYEVFICTLSNTHFYSYFTFPNFSTYFIESGCIFVWSRWLLAPHCLATALSPCCGAIWCDVMGGDELCYESTEKWMACVCMKMVTWWDGKEVNNELHL